jgi:phage shock protein C
LRLSRLIAPDAAHAYQVVPRLESRKLDETRCPIAESLVFVIGEKRPVIPQTAADTAVLATANAHQFTGLRHRQGLQQYSVYKSEDCRCRADSQGERQYRSGRETGGVRKLSQRVSGISPELHGFSHPYGHVELTYERIVRFVQSAAPVFGRGSTLFVSGRPPEAWSSMREPFTRETRILFVGRQAMYCNYCGKVIQDDANVCAYCGTRVGAVTARKRLVRPRADRKIAGVCAGFAEYFDLDVTLVRLLCLLVALMTGVGFLAYPIAWIVMPEEPLRLAAPAADPHVINP